MSVFKEYGVKEEDMLEMNFDDYLILTLP